MSKTVQQKSTSRTPKSSAKKAATKSRAPRFPSGNPIPAGDTGVTDWPSSARNIVRRGVAARLAVYVLGSKPARLLFLRTLRGGRVAPGSPRARRRTRRTRSSGRRRPMSRRRDPITLTKDEARHLRRELGRAIAAIDKGEV